MKTRITRTRTVLATLALSGLLLSACGSTDSDAGDTADAGSPDAGFPATIDGVYGKVTIDQKPERVVALNAQYAAMLVELGVQPVAVAASQQQIETGLPWLKDAFDVVDSTLYENGETNLEAVAGYDPDLIVGVSVHQLPEETYQQALDIAPTFPGLAEGAPNPPWQETLRALAKLTGTNAEPVLEAVDIACDEAREAIPQWQGRTYQFVGTSEEQISWGNGTVLECFGLVPADNQNNNNDGSGISYENIDELDADFVMVWDSANYEEQVSSDPRYTALPSVVNESILWTNSLPIANAVNSVGGHRTFDYLIGELLPVLESTTPAS